jgi:hypothetical protein
MLKNLNVLRGGQVTRRQKEGSLETSIMHSL